MNPRLGMQKSQLPYTTPYYTYLLTKNKYLEANTSFFPPPAEETQETPSPTT